MITPDTDRVLITGAAGAVGTALRAGIHDRRGGTLSPGRDMSSFFTMSNG